MKLLLDEMYPPRLADQLVARGHDVIAAITQPQLTNIPDEDVLAAGHACGRAVVTENVGDFVPIARTWARIGRPHSGLVLVARSSFPRDRANFAATLGALVTALDALLEQDPDTSGGAWATWLTS